MTKQKYIDWFYSQQPYWPTPEQCYDKLFPQSAQPAEGEKEDIKMSQRIDFLEDRVSYLEKLLNADPK